MRYLILVFCMLLGVPVSSAADVQFGIHVDSPRLRIGIDVPAYPRLVRVPGYPVYYAPGLNANFFFYDGRYWVFQGGNWYVSSWYNGPWYLVSPYDVPVFILRIPVRYYRHPPPFFDGWRRSAPPRWGEHWGHEWRERHRDWDRWNRRAAPPPAPLPHYQRHYTGRRYPRIEERRREIERRHYHYRPHHSVVHRRPEERGHGRGRRDDHGR